MNTYIKLFIQTFGMFFVALLIGGYFYITTIYELYDEKVKFKLSHDTQSVTTYLKGLEDRIRSKSYTLSNDQQIAEYLNSKSNDILKYTDKFLEKPHNSFLITIYDDRGVAILKNGLEFDLKQRQYNQNGEITSTQFTVEKYVNKNCALDLKSNFKNNTLAFCLTKEILHQNKIVGFVKISYFLGKKDIETLNKNLHYPIFLDAGNNKIVKQEEGENHHLNIVESLVHDGSFKLYAHHLIDENFLKEEKEKVLQKFILIVFFLLLFSWFISFFITKKLFLQPLQKLKESIENIKNDKNYTLHGIEKNDEIGIILNEFQTIFKQLSDAASYNDAYIKSINDTNLVSKTDLKGIITYSNDSFEKTSGYTKNELLGNPHNMVRHPDMPKEAFKNLWETIQSGQVWRGVVKNKTKDGGYYWTDAVVTPVTDKYGKTIEYISIRRDITELIEQKKQLLNMINFDPLTGLASRSRLESDLKGTKNPALALINIDGFSQINDFYGHNFGDLVLQKFAIRLQELASEFNLDMTVYRQNGDEFVILYDTKDTLQFISIVDTILSLLENTSFSISDENIDLTVSCGISFEPFSSSRLSADMALRISKKNKTNYIVYDEKLSLNKLYESNILWARKLKTAIANDKIVPFFQPIVNNLTKKYEKYEALVRMVAEDGKIISPYFFLEIAKKTKQYIQLTNIMLEKTFETFSQRSEEFSINITMEDIINQSINQTILNLLEKYEGIGERVVFEIVESESIDGNYETVLDFVGKIKFYGCKIAIDDFGSGYSNFEYLIKLKADFIKIDGSLIKDINTKKEAFIVVQVIVSFAKQMGIKTIAEFVEDNAILKTLEDLGIDYSQGYYFSPPMQNL